MTESLEETLTEAKYYCRDLQVSDIIFKETEEFKNKANHGEGFELLERALTMPPILFDFWIKQLKLNPGEFLDKITPASIDGAKHGKTLLFLSNLQKACNFYNRRISEVAIDSENKTLPPSMQVIFANNLPALEKIAQEGSKQAAINILQILEGDIPLHRYKRDLIADRINLQLGIEGEIGSLPTKLPNVDLRFFYNKNQQLPILSVVVKPF